MNSTQLALLMMVFIIVFYDTKLTKWLGKDGQYAAVMIFGIVAIISEMFRTLGCL